MIGFFFVFVLIGVCRAVILGLRGLFAPQPTTTDQKEQRP